MNFHLKKSQIFKLLLLINTLIVLAFTINHTQAQEVEATKLKALESAVYYDKNTGLEWLAGSDKATNWYDAKKWVGAFLRQCLNSEINYTTSRDLIEVKDY